jgi:hypothetical protein
MSEGRLAAIDIGSDTIYMIVVQRHRGNRLKHVLEKSRLMELGLLEERWKFARLRARFDSADPGVLRSPST